MAVKRISASASDPVVGVPLPSADLINYRFDQSDKQQAKIDQKLDSIIDGLDKFVTKEDSNAQRRVYNRQIEDHGERIEKLETKSDRQDGAISLLNKLLLALSGIAAILGALWWVKG